MKRILQRIRYWMPLHKRYPRINDLAKCVNKQKAKVWCVHYPLPKIMYQREVEMNPNFAKVLTYEHFVKMFFIDIGKLRYIERMDTSDMFLILTALRQRCDEAT